MPLLCANGVCPPVRPCEDFGAVVGREDDDGVLVDAHVLQLLHHDPDVVVELRHASFVDGPAVLRIAQFLVFFRQMSDDMHACRIKPKKKRLVFGLGLFDEFDCRIADFVVYGLHPLGIERPSVLDPLFTDLAPARIHGGIVHIGRP